MKNFNDLYSLIANRLKYHTDSSYIASLAKGGKHKITKKIGEECVELGMEVGKENQNRSAIIHEATDLLFHLWVLLGFLKITPDEILDELNRRHKNKIQGYKKSI